MKLDLSILAPNDMSYEIEHELKGLCSTAKVDNFWTNDYMWAILINMDMGDHYGILTGNLDRVRHFEYYDSYQDARADFADVVGRLI